MRGCSIAASQGTESPPHMATPAVQNADDRRLRQGRGRGEGVFGWNSADGHTEYHNKIITKLFGGNSRLGCYALAVTIFSLGIFRDYLYVLSYLFQSPLNSQKANLLALLTDTPKHSPRNPLTPPSSKAPSTSQPSRSSSPAMCSS